ncbi:MAG: gliding motility lipoprotein GldD [Flavobacteriales bacterium]|nr:gliding motility lipoprotein GldD [Flavobacteriales bacterium]
MLKSPLIAAIFIGLFLLSSCKNNSSVLPKPKAQLSLKYPDVTYTLFNTDCPFSFEYSDIALVTVKNNCWITINYPLLKASIDITYKPVTNNIKALLQDAEKLTYSHAIKADGISSQPYINTSKKVYATLYNVTGNAASQLQFHATDSTLNFITGAVYFKAVPNYDSIYPAVNYLEKEVRHLVESISWKNKN